MNKKLVPIGSIGKVQSGFAFKSSDFLQTGVRLLRNTNILPGKVYWEDQACIAEERLTEYPDYRLSEGDILLSLDRPIISSGIKIARVGFQDLPALLVQRVGRFRINNAVVDADYFYAFLRSPTFVESVSGHEQSIGVPHVSPAQIEAVFIPLPELHVQRSLAARLTTQLIAVEEARQAAQGQITELTNLAHAIIRESLNHPDIETHLLGDVLDEVKRGVGASWADYPVLGATRSGLAPAREPVGKTPERYKPVFKGTVFYNPMRILIGSIAMVDEHDAPGITSPDYVVLRGRAGLVDSRWFYYWLRSPEGERCIASLARGAVRERMLFNRLAEGEISLPPYEVQVAASKALADIRPLKTHVEAQLRDIELLPSRLLSAVFGPVPSVQEETELVSDD